MAQLDDVISKLNEQLADPSLSQEKFNELMQRRKVLVARRDEESHK